MELFGPTIRSLLRASTFLGYVENVGRFARLVSIGCFYRW